MSQSIASSSLSRDSAIVDEIRAVRQSYLQRGGSDVTILAHLADLEKEALAIKMEGKKGSHRQETPAQESIVGEGNFRTTGKLDELEKKLTAVEKKVTAEKLRKNLNELSLRTEVSAVMTSLVPNLNATCDRSLPYDANAGFVIVYDFVTGLPKETATTQLSVALYTVSKGVGQYGQPVFLDPVYTVPTDDPQMLQMAFIGAKQPVTRCLPNSSTCLIIELLASSAYNIPVTCAWTRLDLFGQNDQFLNGQWRIPFLKLPIQPEADTSSLAKFSFSEVFVRLAVSSASSTMLPTIPPTETYLPHSKQTVRRAEKTREPLVVKAGHNLSSAEVMSIQIDRIKGAEPIKCKIRLTAYHRTTGKVMRSDSMTPITCTTSTIHSLHRHKYHVFGQQERSFDGINLKGDEILIARLYMVSDEVHHGSLANSRNATDGQLMSSSYLLLEDEEMNGDILVAWGMLALVAAQKKGRRSSQGVDLNTGNHIIPLFCPPVPDIGLTEKKGFSSRERYQKATLRLKVCAGFPRPGSLTPSEESDDPPSPEAAWILHERMAPATDPFTATDGFDLYIDGCRFLPENVSVTRMSASVLDKQYTKVGRAMSCIAKLSSDIHSPVYGYRVEFREPAMPPTSTLIIKVYTTDSTSGSSVIVGYALLNVFVETGTWKQPLADAGMQVSLNEGGHQLRIHTQGPSGSEPLSQACIANKRHVPCATVLVRLVKAVLGPQGKPLEADRVPHTSWVKLGLFLPMPAYADRVYYSGSCRPTRGEQLLFCAMQNRTLVTVREVLQLGLAKPKDLKKHQTDAELEIFLQKRFNEVMDMIPVDYDLTFISPFSPQYGIKISVDEARNIPWPNFTEAHICCNPPAAFYKDDLQPAAFEKPFFIKKLDLSSTNREPVWNDGFFHFNYLSYHKFLTVIIHLKEIEVKITPLGYKYSLRDEAWTAVQVFDEDFVYTSHYQLPLIHGSPTPDDLHFLEFEPFKDWLIRSIRYNKIQFVPEASVMVRLCDGRRDDELPARSPDNIKTKLDMSYLPVDTIADYQRNGTGQLLLTMVPEGKRPEEFADNLANRFKRLVYKLHMEEGEED